MKRLFILILIIFCSLTFLNAADANSIFIISPYLDFLYSSNIPETSGFALSAGGKLGYYFMQLSDDLFLGINAGFLYFTESVGPYGDSIKHYGFKIPATISFAFILIESFEGGGNDFSFRCRRLFG